MIQVDPPKGGETATPSSVRASGKKNMTWKKKYQGLMEKIHSMEDRMTNIIYKLKSESIERKRECEVWKEKYLDVQKQMEKERKEREEGEAADKAAEDPKEVGKEEPVEKTGNNKLSEVGTKTVQKIIGSQPTLLQQSLEDTIAKMEAGLIFKLYTVGGKQVCLVKYESITDSEEEISGSIVVRSIDPLGHSDGVELYTIPLKSVSDVFVGKQTEIFTTSMRAPEAEDSLCVSVVGGEVEINIEASNTVQLTAWLFGIHSLLYAHGKKAVLDKASEENKRHFYVLDRQQQSLDVLGHSDTVQYTNPSGLPANSVDTIRQLANEKESIVSVSPNETIRMMTNGRIFSLITDTEIKSVLLFYAPHDGRSGTLYWCDPENRVEDPDQSLELNDVTDIFIGKQADAFQAEHALTLPDHLCFSFISVHRDLALNLTTSTEEQITAWLFGVDSILSSDGKKFKLNEDDEKIAPNGRRASRTFSVLSGANEEEDDPDFHPEQPYMPYADKADNAILMMTTGANMTRYVRNGDDVQIIPIFIFYEKDKGKFGTFFWGPVDEGRNIDKSRRLALHTLTDLFVEHDIFKNFPPEVQKSSVSLITQRIQLHLKTDSKRMLNSWVSGIKHILTECGQKVTLYNSDADFVAGAPKTIPEIDKPSIPKTPPTLPAPSGPKIDENSPIRDIIEHMMQGCLFKRHIANKVTGKLISSAAIFVFFDPDDGKNGCIYWCKPGPKVKLHDRKLFIHKVRDIYFGKKLDVFKNPEFDDVSQEDCLSLRSSRGELNLQVADSSQTGIVQFWLKGLQHIVTNHKEDVSESAKSGTVLQELKKKQPKEPKEPKQVESPKLAEPKQPEPEQPVENSTPKPEQSEQPKHSEPEQPLFAKPEEQDNGEDKFDELPGTGSTETQNKRFSFIDESARRAIDKKPHDAVSDELTFEEKVERALTQMQSGDKFDRYNEEQPDALKCTLRYIPGAPVGHLVCTMDDTGKSETIHVNALVDVFVGKQKEILQKTIAGEEMCVAFLSADVRFYLVAPNIDCINIWVSGVKHVLEQCGQNILLQTETTTAVSGVEYNKRRMSVVTDPTDESSPTRTFNQMVEDMKRGYQFIDFGKERSLTNKDIILFYDDSEEGQFSKYGSLYWYPVGQARVRDPNCCIRLQLVTDIYIGKQHSIFQEEELAHAIEGRCISIKSKANQEFHGEGPSAATIKDWLSGLNYILSTKAEREIKLIDSDVISDSAGGSFQRQSYSVSKSGGGGKSGTEAIKHMIKGDNFTVYGKDSEESIFLFFNKNVSRPMGALAWHIPNVTDHVWSLKSLVAIHHGRTATSQQSAEAEDHLCITLVGSNDNDLHLKAASFGSACTWIQGVQAILRKFKVPYTENVPSPEVPAIDSFETRIITIPASAEPVPVTTDGSVTLTDANTAVDTAVDTTAGDPVTEAYTEGEETQHVALASLSTGSAFTLIGTDHPPIADLKLFYVASAEMPPGVIYWHHGEEDESAANRLPLRDVSEMYVGTVPKEMRDDIQGDWDESRVMTLIAENKYFFFQFDEASDLNEVWVTGLHDIWANVNGNQILVVDLPPSDPTSAETGEEPVAHTVMVESTRWRWYFTSDNGTITGKEVDIDIRKQPAAQDSESDSESDILLLCWQTVGADEQSELLLTKLSDVYVGKGHPFFTSPACDLLNAEYMSLDFGKDVLHLESESAAQINDWLASFSAVMGQFDFRVEDKKTKEPISRDVVKKRRIKIKKRTTNKIIEKVLQIMQEGVTFKSFKAGEVGDTQPPEVAYQKLFFDPDDNKYGTLYWCDPDKHEKIESQCIPVNTVTDIYVHKLNSFFPVTSNEVVIERCISLIAKYAQFHAEAATESVIDDWVVGLNHVLKVFAKRDIKVMHKHKSKKKGKSPSAKKKRGTKGPEAIKLVSTGLRFIMYIVEKDQPHQTKDVMLFYRPPNASETLASDKVSCGALHWTEFREGEEQSFEIIESQTVSVGQFRDLYIGKSFPVAVEPGVRKDQCCSMIGKEKSLYLRAASSEIIENLFDAIVFLLSAADASQALSSIEESETQTSMLTSATESDAMTTDAMTTEFETDTGAYTDTDAEAKANDQTTAAATDTAASATDTAGETTAGEEESPEILKMVQGAKFTSWGTEENPKRESIFLSLDEKGSRVGRLTWVDDASISHEFPLHEITDIYRGKKTKYFKSDFCAEASSKSCFSLVGANQQLHVEAEAPAILQGWFKGLAELFDQLQRPKKIVKRKSQKIQNQL